jgi:hypothetical protein
MGPVEYIVIGFPGNEFKGEIAPALARLVESGTVRIIDLIFVKKDEDGSLTSFEYDALEEAAEIAMVDGEAGGLLSEDDIVAAADSLPPGTSAAVLVWEDTWAAEFAHAVRNANGMILDGGRIPYELVEAAFADLPPAN